jgi:hypothetical protein
MWSPTTTLTRLTEKSGTSTVKSYLAAKQAAWAVLLEAMAYNEIGTVKHYIPSNGGDGERTRIPVHHLSGEYH